MKRLLATVLLVAAPPLHAATDVRDLFKALMLGDEKLPVLQSWSFEAAGTEEVAWEQPGIEWSEGAEAYTRTGRVVLLWSGGPSDGLDWQITLLGGRAGPDRLEIDSVGNYQELDGGLPELGGIELTPRRCDGSATYGLMVYDVEAPGKKPAYLFHEWSCGSAGCAVKLELHIRKETLASISEIPPCSAEAEE